MTLTRQQQKEQTRQLLIATAYDVYSKRGFSVAAKEIAEQAGVSQGTVFLHFPTVQDLIEDIVEDFGEKLTPRLHEIAASAASIEDFLTKHIDILSENEAFYTRLVQDQAMLPEPAQNTFICIQSAASSHMDMMLAKDDRVVDVPHFIIFNSWIGLIHHYLANKRLFIKDDRRSVLQTHKKVLAETFVKMIVKK